MNALHRHAATGPGMGIPFVRPDLPESDALLRDIEAVLRSGMLTKGDHVRLFEDAARGVLGVEHVVAVSSCSVGLALVLRSLVTLAAGREPPCDVLPRCGLPTDARRPGAREVILPSFVFLAAPAAVVWAGLTPVFVDVDGDDFTVSPAAVEAAITDRTAAILACHTFGCPCDVDRLQAIATRAGVPLVVDAAHGLGARHGGRQVGREGTAQVFSLSPTKLVVAGEGGLIATSCGCLASLLRQGREYGNDGSYGCSLAGLNARMPEISAVIGKASLARLDTVVERRTAAAHAYADRLGRVPGIGMQRVRPGDGSSWKDFSITIDPGLCGTTRDELRSRLTARGIDTRGYYDPPCHRMKAFRSAADAVAPLPVTDRLSASSLALPMGVHVTPDVATVVAAEIEAAVRDRNQVTT